MQTHERVGQWVWDLKFFQQSWIGIHGNLLNASRLHVRALALLREVLCYHVFIQTATEKTCLNVVAFGTVWGIHLSYNLL